MTSTYGLPTEHWARLSEQDRALVSACHWYQDSQKRWAGHRGAGLENKELMAVIKAEFGTDAGKGGPGLACVRVKARTPEFRWGRSWTEMPEKPTLKGAKLRNEVRRVMAIPWGRARQMRMF